jgi:hypothetical protein
MGPTSAIVSDDDDRDCCTGCQFRDSSCPGHAVANFKDAVRILVHENRGHAMLNLTVFGLAIAGTVALWTAWTS